MVRLNEPVIVDDAAKCGDVNEAVESLPTFASQAANPIFRRRERERD